MLLLCGGSKRTQEADIDRACDYWRDWQKRVDGRVRSVVDNISPFGALHKDVKTLSDRIAELEAKLQKLAEDESNDKH